MTAFFKTYSAPAGFGTYFGDCRGADMVLRGCVGADTRKRRKSLDFFGSNADFKAFVMAALKPNRKDKEI